MCLFYLTPPLASLWGCRFRTLSKGCKGVEPKRSVSTPHNFAKRVNTTPSARLCIIYWFYVIVITYYCNNMRLDILLLGVGCFTRFSCTLIKYYSQLAKISISPIHTLYSNLSPHTRWTNWPINHVHVSNKIWRQIFPCHISTCILYPFSER